MMIGWLFIGAGLGILVVLAVALVLHLDRGESQTERDWERNWEDQQ